MATMPHTWDAPGLVWDQTDLPDPLNEDNWRQVALPTKSSCTVTSLTSGAKYWFREAAVGATGQGPWNDQAMKMAP